MDKLLFIDKPKSLTSFDVCYKLRKVLGTKKIGHTGTLDPNATGVMVVLFDNATKAAQFIVDDNKTYYTRVIFGIETDTLDIDGNILNRKDYVIPDKKEIEDVLNSFEGKSKQEVPLTSAKKINGKKLYEYQRENIDINPPIIDINVFSIELKELFDDGFSFITNVSSGTYIRSLVRDILKKLNIIGTVLELRRIAVGDVNVNDCDKFDDILNGNYRLHNLFDFLKKYYNSYEVSNRQDIINGKRIIINSNDSRLLITNDNELLAIYEKDGNEYKCLRGLL